MTPQEWAAKFFAEGGFNEDDLTAIIEAAQAEARADERAKVVAWLRSKTSDEMNLSATSCSLLNINADNIERGEHLK